MNILDDMISFQGIAPLVRVKILPILPHVLPVLLDRTVTLQGLSNVLPVLVVRQQLKLAQHQQMHVLVGNTVKEEY